MRCAELEGPRLGALLDFFVRHFIKMAERCHQYQAYRQKTVYLDQADRLSIILSELSRYTDDAKAYRKKICDLRMKPMSSARTQQDEPPKIPKRNGEAAIFVTSLKDRFIRKPVDVTVESPREQSQSNREDCTDKAAKTTTNEVRFEEKTKKVTENTQVKSVKPCDNKSDEITCNLKNSTLKKKSNGSTSPANEKVSIVGNQNESFLTETTYI